MDPSSIALITFSSTMVFSASIVIIILKCRCRKKIDEPVEWLIHANRIVDGVPENSSSS